MKCTKCKNSDVKMEVYVASIKKMDLTKVRESDAHAKRAAVNLIVRTTPPKSTFTKSEVRNVLRDPSKHLRTLHPKQQTELIDHIKAQEKLARKALEDELPRIPNQIRQENGTKVITIQPANDLKREKALDAFRAIRRIIENVNYKIKK